MTTFELPGCIDMWTVVGDPVNKLTKVIDPEDENTEQPEEVQ